MTEFYDILKQLIRIPSVVGADLSGNSNYEAIDSI